MSEKKIRVNIPTYIHNILKNDEEDFGINRNKLCNLIFFYYSEEVDDSISLFKSKFNSIVQFNLTEENKDIFFDIVTRKNIQSEANYFRAIFTKYSDQAKFQREQLLFSKSVKMINEAIKTQQKIKVKYKDEYRVLEPYLIIPDKEEKRSYIFCFCEKNNEFRNYRLSVIKPIVVLKEKWGKYDLEKITQVHNDFDVFLSYDQRVKVRLTEAGREQLARAKSNKPKLICIVKDVFTFECSIKKAQIYFPQFLGNAEILEPIELREWFREMYKNVAEVYLKGE